MYAYVPYGASASQAHLAEEAVRPAKDVHEEDIPSRSLPEGPSCWRTTWRRPFIHEGCYGRPTGSVDRKEWLTVNKGFEMAGGRSSG